MAKKQPEQPQAMAGNSVADALNHAIAEKVEAMATVQSAIPVVEDAITAVQIAQQTAPRTLDSILGDPEFVLGDNQVFDTGSKRVGNVIYDLAGSKIAATIYLDPPKRGNGAQLRFSFPQRTFTVDSNDAAAVAHQADYKERTKNAWLAWYRQVKPTIGQSSPAAPKATGGSVLSAADAALFS